MSQVLTSAAAAAAAHSAPVRSDSPVLVESLLEESWLQPAAAAARPRVALMSFDKHPVKLSAEDARVLDICLRTLGFAEGMRATRMVHYRRLCVRRLPRNVPWSDYPLIGGPYWKSGQMRLDASAPPEQGSQDVARLLAGVDAIVFLGCCEFAKADLARLEAMLPGEPRRRHFYSASDLCKLESKPFDALDMDQARACDAAERPLQRFLWNWHVNWEGLGIKAMKEVGLQPPEAARNRRLLAHPWTLQMLYAIRRVAQGTWEGEPMMPRAPDEQLSINTRKGGRTATTSRWSGSTVAAFPGWKFQPETYSAGLGCYESNGTYARDSYAIGLSWPGTGRWPALPLPGLGGFGDGALLEDICNMLLETGLAQIPPRAEKPETMPESEHSKRQVPVTRKPALLSPQAASLLDLLPPDMEDPDLLLRWRQHPVMNQPMESDIPAMDRYVNDRFRKLKRRLKLEREMAAPAPAPVPAV